MINDVISYVEMCRREGQSLQRGMNFSLSGLYSVILMSVRPNAPYRDRFENGGFILIYEGHDLSRSATVPDPKRLDQPEKSVFGKLTENGKFFQAAAAFKRGEGEARRVRVYEKIKEGIWSYNGLFRLVDAWNESDGQRMVFKFKLEADLESDEVMLYAQAALEERRRVIPSQVKVEVWKRDKGQCVICGAQDELHFDHVVPYSKGGTSAKAMNVQLLCARHNLSKSDKIL